MSTQMNVILEPGQEHCLYLPEVLVGQTMEFDFLVTETSGAEGKHDIDVTFSAPPPEARVLYDAKRYSEGNYNDIAEVAGDYKLCLDNTMSTWAEKVVWLEITLHDPTDDYYEDYIGSEEMKELERRNEDTETLFEMTIKDFRNYISSTRTNLGKTRHFQLMQGADTSKDTHNVIRMNEKIDFWSVVHISIMLLIGFVQVYTVRQLFEDKSFWYKLRSRK